MKLRTIITALTLCLFFQAAMALEEKTVSGEYTFYGNGSQSRDECKRLALEGARIEAIRSAFGTVVAQDIVQDDRVDDSGESTYFAALSSTEVKGEWIADEGEPEFSFTLDSDGNMVVKCTVRGRVRELSNESTDFNAVVLRNGNEKRFADNAFRNGDAMKLLLKTPVDGYAAVFLAGTDRTVYSLLPYLSDTTGEVKLRRGREYVFFDLERADPSHGIVDELILTTDDAVEHNRLYVVFSPNRFSRAVDTYTDDLTPRQLSFDDFNRWLAKSRKNDPRMGVKIINLRITNK